MRVYARWPIVLVAWLALAAPAYAAFPGRDGMLAVQPLREPGLILVGASGADPRRVCTEVSVCGHPGRPMFSPDGRDILFAGRALDVIGTDGSCLDCGFGGAGTDPAFRANGALVTFISGGAVLEDGIDGLRQATPKVAVREVSGAVWSASGELALVSRGRVWAGAAGHLRQIGPGAAPSWSPDGSQLALVRGGWITIVTVANRSARRLVRGTAPAFSPDGRSVAFVDPRHRVRIVLATGGRSRAVGDVTGRAVDWQPVPAHPALCVAPPGSKVLARSAQAVVTTDSARPSGGDDDSLPNTAILGCLYANGRERLLERTQGNNEDGDTDFPLAAVGGGYAAVLVENDDPHYEMGDQSVSTFSLRTGHHAGFDGETSCSPVEGCGGIDGLVVGANGVSAAHVSPDFASIRLGVVCASASLCVATDDFGNVLSSTSPAEGPWSTGTGASMGALAVGSPGGGSCPSTSLCVLVAGSSIYTSTDPAADAWTTTQVPNAGFSAVDCPTTSLCVATTVVGQVVLSTDPTGGPSAWTVDDVDGDTAMYGISCPSNSDCLATDIEGNVVTSTDPTGGAAAWSVHAALGRDEPFDEITCPTTSLCLSIDFLPGTIALASDPVTGPWRTVGPRGIDDLACPSASLCVGVGGNSVTFSTDPTSGGWNTYTLGNATPEDLTNVSCPTMTFCVANGGGPGDVLVSTDPTGGPSTWTPVLADEIDCAQTPDACGTEQIIASDATGVHTLDQSTEFEAQTGPQLTGLALNDDTLSWNDHGSPRSAQLTP